MYTFKDSQKFYTIIYLFPEFLFLQIQLFYFLNYSQNRYIYIYVTKYIYKIARYFI